MTASQFGQSIIPLHGAMLALAVRMLADTQDAEDTVQDTLRYLWEKHDDIPTLEYPAAFVLRCVRNRCLDRLRQHSGHHISTTHVDLSVVADNTEADDDNEAIFAGRIEIVMQTIDKMPPNRRDVMKLSLKGMTVASISAELGITESNTRQILSRARRQLRDKLADRY